MTTLTQTPPQGQVFAGVDTHADTHHAAAVDGLGRALGDREFPATPEGYRALLPGCVRGESSDPVWKALAPTEPSWRGC